MWKRRRRKKCEYFQQQQLSIEIQIRVYYVITYKHTHSHTNFVYLSCQHFFLSSFLSFYFVAWHWYFYSTSITMNCNESETLSILLPQKKNIYFCIRKRQYWKTIQTFTSIHLYRAQRAHCHSTNSDISILVFILLLLLPLRSIEWYWFFVQLHVLRIKLLTDLFALYLFIIIRYISEIFSCSPQFSHPSFFFFLFSHGICLSIPLPSSIEYAVSEKATVQILN